MFIILYYIEYSGFNREFSFIPKIQTIHERVTNIQYYKKIIDVSNNEENKFRFTTRNPCSFHKYYNLKSYGKNFSFYSHRKPIIIIINNY